jgi:transcriptional regulator with XRE-family HTH domain
MVYNTMPEPTEEIGVRVLAAREHHGYTQAQVAEWVTQLVGGTNEVQQTHISRIEANAYRPNDRIQRALAVIFHVAPGWITHGDLSGGLAPTWWAEWRAAHDVPAPQAPKPRECPKTFTARVMPSEHVPQRRATDRVALA